MVVVVLWCARWSSLALVGVQKHRGVLVCRRGHRKHDNDPQSGGTGEGKYRQNKRQRKFLTSAGFPSVWCLSGVPEGLLIAGDHQTSIQTRGKSNSPPSRSRPRQRGRRCSFDGEWQSRIRSCCVLLVHRIRQRNPSARLNRTHAHSTSSRSSLPSCASETTKYNPYGSRILQPLTQNLPSRLSSNFEELLSRSPLGRPVMGLRIGEILIEY